MTAQFSSDSQQLLTILVQATAELAQLNEHYSQKLDTVETKVDRFDVKINRVETKVDTFDTKLSAKIAATADQIGKLTESMTAFRVDLDDIKETIWPQVETAKAKAESVSQLIALLGKIKVCR